MTACSAQTVALLTKISAKRASESTDTSHETLWSVGRSVGRGKFNLVGTELFRQMVRLVSTETTLLSVAVETMAHGIAF